MLVDVNCVSDVTQVETEVFDKIDELIASGRGDEEYRELFKDMLVISPYSHIYTPSLLSPHTI